MIYVALLRGINVGGKNKVDMKILKKTFESAGMESVITYINSGNIVFMDSRKKKEEIISTLENAILNDFGLPIKVIILDYDAYQKIVNAIPGSWQNNKEMRSDVMFLWDEVNQSSVLDKLVIHPDIDSVKYVDGALLWSAGVQQISRSGKMKLAGTSLYQKMTVRNVNTARKIFELMNGLKRSIPQGIK